MKEGRSPISVILRVAVLLVAILILFAVFHGNCQLTSVSVVKDTEHYSDEEIKEMVFTSPVDRYAILFYFRWFFSEVDDLPFIEKIDTELIDKNTISLRVYEKRIIGCVQMMGQYFYFDRDGLVVESSFSKLEHIPLIVGLEFDNIVLHRTLCVQKEALYQVILNLTRLIETYQLDISQIQFLHDDSVVLHSGDTEVRLGGKNNYDIALSSLNEIIQKLEDKSVIIFMENYSETNKDIIAKKKNKK